MKLPYLSHRAKLRLVKDADVKPGDILVCTYDAFFGMRVCVVSGAPGGVMRVSTINTRDVPVVLAERLQDAQTVGKQISFGCSACWLAWPPETEYIEIEMPGNAGGNKCP